MSGLVVNRIMMIETIELRRLKSVKTDIGMTVLSIKSVDGETQSFFLSEEVLGWLTQAAGQLAPAGREAAHDDSSLAQAIKLLN